MMSATPLALNVSSFSVSSTCKFFYPIFVSPRRINVGRLKVCAQTAISRNWQGAFDPELRAVLELATDSELYELERILFGPSYFSPLLKSITKRTEVDYAMIEEDLEEREAFIAVLESRFLFLAADARSTLRGWRPSYRNVLLEDSSREESETFPDLVLDIDKASEDHGGLEQGLSQWKVQALAALKVGAGDFQSMILKGSGILTLAKIYQLLTRKLSGKVVLEAANYQTRKELIKKGGQLASINLETRAALLAAKQALGNSFGRSRHSNARN